MIMRIFSVDYEINFEKGSVPVLMISNQSYYTKLITNLRLLSEGEESDENIVVEENDKILDFKNQVYFVMDFFAFSPNQKKIITALYQRIEKTAALDSETIQLFRQSVSNTLQELNSILEEIPLELTFNMSPEICDYLKMSDVKIHQEKNSSILERLFTLIDVLAFLKTHRLIVLVNAKIFLTDEEILEVYKYALYTEVKILLIESGEPDEKLPYEEIVWIDEDYVVQVV